MPPKKEGRKKQIGPHRPLIRVPEWLKRDQKPQLSVKTRGKGILNQQEVVSEESIVFDTYVRTGVMLDEDS